MTESRQIHDRPGTTLVRSSCAGRGSTLIHVVPGILYILLQRARRNSRNPLLVKVLDWTGSLVQSVLLADADDWIRSRLQGMTVELSEYLRLARVIVVGSKEMDNDELLNVFARQRRRIAKRSASVARACYAVTSVVLPGVALRMAWRNWSAS